MRRWVWWSVWGGLGLGVVLLVPTAALADNCSSLSDCFGSGTAAAGAAAAGAGALGALGGFGSGRGQPGGVRQPMPGVGAGTPGSNVGRDAPTGPTGAEREAARQAENEQRMRDQMARDEQQRRDAEAAREREQRRRDEEPVFEQGTSPGERGATGQVPGEGAGAPGSNVERDAKTKP